MKRLFLLLFTFWYGQIYGQVAADTLGYREISDISYLAPEDVVTDSLQRLNLVLPEGVSQPPLLVWIGGGAWSFVDRHVEMNLARKFAREGIAVAAVGHQLSKGLFRDSTRTQGVQHPAHIKDIAAAFRWLYDHADEYGYSQENLFVGGFSSGGHLAALLAMDDRYLAAHGLTTQEIKGIIPIAGAYDINHYQSVFLNNENPQTRKLADTHVKDVFGSTEADFIAASPTTYMDKLDVPMLLISERGSYDYTKLFEEKIRESGYQGCQILHVFNFGHAALWRDISNSPDSQTRRMMIDFIWRNTFIEPMVSDTIPFLLTGHNNISIQAVLNKIDTVQLMFHTAASSVTMIKATAEKLASLELNQADTVKSWGGDHASRYSDDNSLQIGSLQWEHLTVWENEHSGPMTDGKFGPDLFQDKVIEINFDKNFMVIHASLPEIGEDYERLNLIMENGFLFIEGTISIGAKEYGNRFLIHSGYGGALLLDDEFVRANDIGVQLEIIEESELKDSYGNILKTKKAILPSFTLGNTTLLDLPVGFFEGSIGRQKMSVMGGAVLKQFNMFIDTKESCIYLKANGLMR